ncbi:hypothetical protein HMPREF0541_00066 [Lacticaseibacillus rhamnosus ATCC 21052]|nr:hypothetical protein HMPREF0541_00066 [Lacticaseibacillus rhamnosus ATCC 21052]
MYSTINDKRKGRENDENVTVLLTGLKGNGHADNTSLPKPN